MPGDRGPLHSRAGRIATCACFDAAVRIAAKESSKALARSMHPEIESKDKQQQQSYSEMTDAQLFETHTGRQHQEQRLLEVGSFQQLVDERSCIIDRLSRTPVL